MIRCAFAAALPVWQGELSLQLAAGASVAHVLQEAREVLQQRGVTIDDYFWSQAPIGIFGERCERSRLVLEGDRVEIYRSLAVDPKAARRERARHTQTNKGRNPLTAKPRRGA
ncbi:MAG: RnfH family protein [Gammaproteobacteria bacterium]|nr:RnfH family protein [Gammaproteobacteria bacterium]